MNVEKAWSCLKTSPWGLVLAYVISVVVSYLAIWALIEPLGIPEDLDSLTLTLPFITQRWCVHIASSFIIGAFVTLILDVAFREHVLRLLRGTQGPIAARTLQEYDEAFNDFCKQLAFAMGRYFEYKRSPRKRNEMSVMKRVNEVRRAQMRLLKVCGEQLRAFLVQNGTEWFNDVATFIQRAGDVETRVSAIASEDRSSVEAAIRDKQPRQ